MVSGLLNINPSSRPEELRALSGRQVYTGGVYAPPVVFKLLGGVPQGSDGIERDVFIAQVALLEGVALKAGEPRGVIQDITGCRLALKPWKRIYAEVQAMPWITCN